MVLTGLLRARHAKRVMTLSDLLSLPDLSDGFLLPVQLHRLGTGVMVQGGFDTGRFAPQLFDQLGVHRPDSLSRAIDKRLAEFLAGRCMAQIAQAGLGHTPRPVLIGADRAPIWPNGIAGAITHARGRCACFAVPAGQGAPGLDTERIATGSALDAILRMTLSADEGDLIRHAPDVAQTATLCFSAKETLFKALYPTVRRHFGFSCAELKNLPGDTQLQLVLTEDLHNSLPAGAVFDIQYHLADGYVTTWMLHRSCA